MCLCFLYLNNEFFPLPYCVTVFVLPQECVCVYYPSFVTVYYLRNFCVY